MSQRHSSSNLFENNSLWTVYEKLVAGMGFHCYVRKTNIWVNFTKYQKTKNRE